MMQKLNEFLKRSSFTKLCVILLGWFATRESFRHLRQRIIHIHFPNLAHTTNIVRLSERKLSGSTVILKFSIHGARYGSHFWPERCNKGLQRIGLPRCDDCFL